MKAIRLTQGQFTFLDDEDYERASAFNWYAAKFKKAFYAQTKADDSVVQMQRFILGAQRGQIVDHRNHDTLDNRRINLRLCTRTENARNQKVLSNRLLSSKFKGVCWHTRRKKWQAYIGSEPKIHIGYYPSELEAAKAYDRVAIVKFGTFSCINFNRVAVPVLSPSQMAQAIDESEVRTVIHWRHRVSPSSKNASAAKFFSANGVTMTLPQWATRTGINSKTLYKRIAAGMKFEDAITTPVNAAYSRSHCLPNIASTVKSPMDC